MKIFSSSIFGAPISINMADNFYTSNLTDPWNFKYKITFNVESGLKTAVEILKCSFSELKITHAMSNNLKQLKFFRFQSTIYGCLVCSFLCFIELSAIFHLAI